MTCSHVMPGEVQRLLSAGGARMPDVCHKAHLYTVSLGAFEVRVTLAADGRTTTAARLAGLPNKVIGLFWPAAAWAELALLDAPTAGSGDAEAAWFIAHRDEVADAVANIGIHAAEKRLATLAQHARPRGAGA